MPTFGLDYQGLYQRVQKYANINNITNSDTDAKNAVNDALRKIAAERRWLALRRQGTITPIASQQSYSLSSFTGFNFPVRCFYISNGIEQDIRIVSEEEWSHKYDNDSDGTPSICAFLDISGETKVYFSLRPSAAFVSLYSTIYIDWDRKPTELSSDTDVPEIPNTNNQLAIVYFAVSEILLSQGDLNGAGGWEAKGRKELRKALTSDIHFRGIKRKSTKPMFGILEGIYRSRPQQDYRGAYR